MTTTKPQETFAERLVRLRKVRGLTQLEVANHLGTSQRMMAYYESEESRPPAKLLPQLADVLGVSVDELLGRSRPRQVAAAPEHSRLWRKLRAVEKLGEADRKAVVRFIDALLARQELETQRG